MFGAWALQFEALCSCVMGEWHKGTFRHQSSVEGSTPLSVTAQESGVQGHVPSLQKIGCGDTCTFRLVEARNPKPYT